MMRSILPEDDIAVNFNTARLRGKAEPLFLAHGVFKKLDSGRFAFFIQLDGYKIDAPLLGQISVRLLIMISDCSQMISFGRGNRFFRAAELQAGLGSYLDKDEEVFLPGDNIYFPLGATIVSFQDAVAPFFQKITGVFLTQYTCVSPLHYLWTLS